MKFTIRKLRVNQLNKNDPYIIHTDHPLFFDIDSVMINEVHLHNQRQGIKDIALYWKEQWQSFKD